MNDKHTSYKASTMKLMKKLIFSLIIFIPYLSFSQNISFSKAQYLEAKYGIQFVKIDIGQLIANPVRFDTISFFSKKTIKKLIPFLKAFDPLILNDSISWERFGRYLKKMPDNNDSVFSGEYIGNLSNLGLSSIIYPFYIKSEFVTNKEYREFESYVRDSITRRRLGESMEDYLITESIETGEIFNPPHINWKTKIPSFMNTNARSILYSMNYPYFEQFYRKKEIDKRILEYDYLDDSKKLKTVNISPDTISWINHFATIPQNNVKDALISFYYWHPFFDDYPVEGLNSEQIEAFLAWKTEFHQKMLDRKGIPFKVKYNLPTAIDLDITAAGSDSVKLPIPALSDNMIKITNRQYKEFIAWVSDSIIRRTLGGYDSRYLLTDDKYGNYLDPPLLNRKTSINMKDSLVTDNLREITLPATSSGKSKKINPQILNFEFYYYVFPKDSDELQSGYRDRSVFIGKAIVNIYPDTVLWKNKYKASAKTEMALGDKKFDDSLVAGISYIQAFSYYYWKYIYKNKFSKKENPLCYSVIPTEKQWYDYYSHHGKNDAFMDTTIYAPDSRFLYTNGYEKQRILNPQDDYRFRYVVRFYPK